VSENFAKKKLNIGDKNVHDITKQIMGDFCVIFGFQKTNFTLE
jgi:hypothetical protein